MRRLGRRNRLVGRAGTRGSPIATSRCSMQSARRGQEHAITTKKPVTRTRSSMPAPADGGSVRSRAIFALGSEQSDQITFQGEQPSCKTKRACWVAHRQPLHFNLVRVKQQIVNNPLQGLSSVFVLPLCELSRHVSWPSNCHTACKRAAPCAPPLTCWKFQAVASDPACCRFASATRIRPCANRLDIRSSTRQCGILVSS